jgi:orotate phosphoribosyltransferase-like protein
MKRVAEGPESALLTEQQVAERLGLSTNRVRWLTMNGHLLREVTPDGRVGGLTKESVEHERAWRSGATSLQRLRRGLSYVFTWIP